MAKSFEGDRAKEQRGRLHILPISDGRRKDTGSGDVTLLFRDVSTKFLAVLQQTYSKGIKHIKSECMPDQERARISHACAKLRSYDCSYDYTCATYRYSFPASFDKDI